MVSYKCPKCGGNLFRISGDSDIYCDNDKCLKTVGKAVLQEKPSGGEKSGEQDRPRSSGVPVTASKPLEGINYCQNITPCPAVHKQNYSVISCDFYGLRGECLYKPSGDGKGGEAVSPRQPAGTDGLAQRETRGTDDRSSAPEKSEGKFICDMCKKAIAVQADPQFPKCAGCLRSSHNAHCAWAVTGKCKDGDKFEPTPTCYICASPLDLSTARSGEDGRPCHEDCLLREVKKAKPDPGFSGYLSTD
jgi:hypothetical protein